MRTTRSIVAAALLLGAACAAAGAPNAKPFVVPELKEWHGGEGYVSLYDMGRIVVPPGDAEAARIAEAFAADCRALLGAELTAGEGKPGRDAVSLSIKADKGLGDEGYEIRTTKGGVQVTAPTATGLYWATRTLLQVAEQGETRRLPLGTARDWPDYPLRGLVMDCGRKYIPLSYLRDLVKIMSYYKMNTLQVHLNDNGFRQFFGGDWDKTYAAFRLECETYPGLTARDGHYAKSDFADFQDEAAARFVEIIPEIDVPAHSLAFSRYRPEIGSRDYGMDHLDLFNPETYAFLDGLFGEYLAGERPVFRGKRVHVGTDEYSNRDQAVVEKFREFTDHYIRLVEGYGKQACVWGALTHAKGETPVKSEGVAMNAWYNGYADPAVMAREGYKLISIPDGLVYIVPAAGYYYDYLNEPHLYANWTPAHVGNEVFAERSPSILGGMFAVWNDHVGNGITVKDIHHRLYPALQTLSVKMWTGAATGLAWETFDAKRAMLSEAPGVNQRGRLGTRPGLVWQAKEVTPGSTLPHAEIGYGYTVEFDLEGEDEAPGTELFRSPDAVFYLSDPVGGMMGFARDGYLCRFRYAAVRGERARVKVTGDSRQTTLTVDGRVVDRLDVETRYYDDKGKAKMFHHQTLVFPLGRAGLFKSKVSNLRVYNHIR